MYPAETINVFQTIIPMPTAATRALLNFISDNNIAVRISQSLVYCLEYCALCRALENKSGDMIMIEIRINIKRIQIFS